MVLLLKGDSIEVCLVDMDYIEGIQ